MLSFFFHATARRKSDDFRPAYHLIASECCAARAVIGHANPRAPVL